MPVLSQKETIEGEEQSFRANLKDLWCRELLCDVVLISSADSKRIPAHRIVLAAASAYFKTMFLSGMRESELKEVKIDVAGNVLEILVNYFYTTVIDLNETQAKEVYAAAHWMQLDKVVNECHNFLIKNLNRHNCFELLLFAESNRFDLLLESTRLYILNNFQSICEASNVLTVDIDCLQILIHHTPFMPHKKLIFETVKRWINHDKENREIHKDDLLEQINFKAFTPKFLLEEVKSFCTTSKSKEAYLNAMEYHALPNYDKICLDNNEPTNFVLAVGKSISDRGYLDVEAFDANTKTWSALETTVPWRQCLQVLKMGSNLIVLGRSDRTTATSVTSLDLNTLECKNLPSTSLKVDKALVLNRNMYVFQYRGRIEQISVECFDFKQNKWNAVDGFELLDQKSVKDVAILKDHIFFLIFDRSCFNMEIIRFDPLKEELFQLILMSNCTFSFGRMTAFDDKLFIFSNSLETMSFNPDNQEVCHLSKIPDSTRLIDGITRFNDEIIVGQSKDNRLVTYNPLIKDWSNMMPPITNHVQAVCAVRIL